MDDSTVTRQGGWEEAWGCGMDMAHHHEQHLSISVSLSKSKPWVKGVKPVPIPWLPGAEERRGGFLPKGQRTASHQYLPHWEAPSSQIRSRIRKVFILEILYTETTPSTFCESSWNFLISSSFLKLCCFSLIFRSYPLNCICVWEKP